jgi:protoporphyrinogen oxidase
MKVTIIGAGFTGLSAAYDLAKAGHKVVVIEKKSHPGGLAGGFSAQGWEWSLEYYYHHVFATDKAIKNWLTELGLADKLFYKDAESYSLVEGEDQRGGKNQLPGQNQTLQQAKLDSALSLLKFPGLSLGSKLRTGATLVALKLWPYGRLLEKFTAKNFICASMGQQAWEILWKPLFVGKFGELSEEINAAWFWARIYTRSQQLGYFENGFLGMAQAVVKKLKTIGVEFEFSAEVKEIKKNNQQSNTKSWKVKVNNKQEVFDQVLFTGNSQQFLQLAQSQLPTSYVGQLNQLQSLAATALILVLDKPFFKKNIYWLNINCADWPFLAVVEHTNFIDRAHYQNQHLVYVGKYLPVDNQLFAYSKEKLFQHYHSYLEKLCPGFEQNLLDYYLFKDEQAQPVVGTNHSKILPNITTPLPDLFWASMEHVYPYDRGINYAVKLGRDTAQKILHQS